MNGLEKTGLVIAGLAIAAGFTVASCGQTPTNVPIRTFEGAQKVAVVCLQIADPRTGAPTAVTPVAQSLCAPVAAGGVVDEDLSTPGINFIPVGTNPTDVTVAPGDRPDVTYVASASPTKPG